MGAGGQAGRGARRFDRRTLLTAALAGGGAAIVSAASRGDTAAAGASLARAAAATKPAGSDLGAIEHVVFLMQENRSFDHYYGTYPGVRGFDDHPAGKLGAFSQRWPGGRDSHLLPFHLDTASGMGECTHDLSHNWLPQHLCRGRGDNSAFVATHTMAQYEGPQQGTVTMGYHTRARPAVLLRAGRRVHDLRQLSLLGLRPDAPEPADGALGHDRPGGTGRRPRALHQRRLGRGVQRELGHDARGPRRRRGQLEGVLAGGDALHAGVRPTARHADHRRDPLLLPPVLQPELRALPEGVPADLSQRLRH